MEVGEGFLRSVGAVGYDDRAGDGGVAGLDLTAEIGGWRKSAVRRRSQIRKRMVGYSVKISRSVVNVRVRVAAETVPNCFANLVLSTARI